MTLARHTCLNGQDQFGDCFDCPKCWAVLVRSFGRDVPEPSDRLLPLTRDWFEPGAPLPGQRSGPERILPRPPYGEEVEIPDDGPRSLPCPHCGNAYLIDRIAEHVRTVHAPGAHEPEYRVMGEPGGRYLWQTRCECGWSRSGVFIPRDPYDSGGLFEAEGIARTWIFLHRANPDLPPGDGHTVSTAVMDFPHRPGGTWCAACTCGWQLSGEYAPGGSEAARSQADSWAARHRTETTE
jgi:hypothetical protein